MADKTKINYGPNTGNAVNSKTSTPEMSDAGAGHNYRPSPTDFPVFVPFACHEFAVDAVVVVTTAQFTEHMLSKKISRQKADIVQTSPNNMPSSNRMEVSFASDASFFMVHVIAEYANDNLVQVKIENNTRIPRELYKVIALTLTYHSHLNSVVINQGLTMGGIYELRHCLEVSNITEVILDDTYVEAANYYILLDSPNRLRHLSLARCAIEDIGVELIAARLAFPHPASETLALLNLSTNRVTDVGATYLATALRSNRSLYYLNLTDNMISDTGAQAILGVMLFFPLSYSEIIARNERYLKHLRKNHELIDRFISNVRNSNDTKKSIFIYEKAQDMARKIVNSFKDPYKKESFYKEGMLYSNGNNTLAYLNLSFNDLSFVILKTILKVLEYQKCRGSAAKGLVRIKIDGNPLPTQCEELRLISNQLENYIENCPKRLSVGPPKRKSQIR